MLLRGAQAHSVSVSIGLPSLDRRLPKWLDSRLSLGVVQLAGTLLIIALMPSNLGKTAALVGWWALTFRRLSRAEWFLYVAGCALFTLLDIMAVRQGAFAFSRPDFLGLPWWEFLMWGFYLVHAGRTVGGEVRRGVARFKLALGLAAIFALAFLLAPDSRTRFLTTLVALAGALGFFHERGDLLRTGYMVLLGAAVEYTGVWSGQWGYADAPAGGVPLWFAPMWGAVGLFAGRLEPLPLIACMSALQHLRLRPFGCAAAMVAGEAAALRPAPRRPEREDMSDPQSVEAFDGQGAPDGALLSCYQFNALALSTLLPPGGALLDLGCGSGRFLMHLAGRRPDVSITGLDLSPAMIERGQANVMAAGLESRIRLVVGDMTGFSRLAAGRVDVISSVYALHHLPDFARLESCLAEIAAVRARTGCAVWICDHARPRNARTARRFPEVFTPQAAPEFRRDSANSLLASFSCAELSDRLDGAVGGWHHRIAHLPFFQIHWLPAVKELATCERARCGQRACPAARDFLYPMKLRLRTAPCPLYGSCPGGN